MGYFIRRGDLLAYDRTNLLNEQVNGFLDGSFTESPSKKFRWTFC